MNLVGGGGGGGGAVGSSGELPGGGGAGWELRGCVESVSDDLTSI